MSTRMSFVPERLQPVHGRPLKAADLGDLLALADHQRRRHVRALHETWGVAAGLLPDEDENGAPVISAGVAYDRNARLLVLGRSVALPPADELVKPRIVALRADRAAGEPAAVLRLLVPPEVEPGLDVVLGSVWSSDGELNWSGEGRRHVRTAAPVRLAAGRVRHGRAVVTAAPLPDGKDGGPATPHEWSAWVDVDAGFEAVPVYTAGVSVPRTPTVAAAGATAPAPPRFGTATVEISHAAPDGFRVTVRRPGAPGSKLDRATLRTNPQEISWIAALPQFAADVRNPIPPTGPCAGRPA